MTAKMKMKGIDQYNLKEWLFIKIVIMVIELWICFSLFIAFLGVKVSNTLQSRNV